MKLIAQLKVLLVTGLAGIVAVTPSYAQSNSTFEAQAEQSLEQMLAYLKTKNSLSFQANISRDVLLPSGQKIQLGATGKFTLRRPNQLRIDYQGDRRQVRFYYDGTTFTLEEVNKKLYAAYPIASDINTLVNRIEEKLNFNLPLGEIISTDNDLATIKERVTSAMYLGESEVNGVTCKHLAFTQENLDWQIWIETGNQPVPCKLVITYKNELHSPQYTAIFTDWDFKELSAQDSLFTFTPAANATKIDFVIIEQPELNQTSGETP